MPVPYATLGTLAINALRAGSTLSRLTPVGLATAVAVDTGLAVAIRYWHATYNAEKYSHRLADAIKELVTKHQKVRVIAHSLGCRLLINSLQEIPLEKRPHEIHMCAPAVVEDSIDIDWSCLAQNHTHIYWSTRDSTLSLGFPILNNGNQPIGCIGISKNYTKVSSLKVDIFFKDEVLVHRHYPYIFHKFAGLNIETLLPHEKEELIPPGTDQKKRKK